MVTHPCGDYAPSCLTRVSRVSALAVCHCPPSACIPNDMTLSASVPGVPFNSLSFPFFQNMLILQMLKETIVYRLALCGKIERPQSVLTNECHCVVYVWTAQRLLPMCVVSDEHRGWHCLKVAECACAHIYLLYIWSCCFLIVPSVIIFNSVLPELTSAALGHWPTFTTVKWLGKLAYFSIFSHKLYQKQIIWGKN